MTYACTPPPQALSNLSPWLHFGQLAPQRAALEAAKLRPKHKESVEGFLEELVSGSG
jgi:deoxyribodipyrimidine photo-lyase